MKFYYQFTGQRHEGTASRSPSPNFYAAIADIWLFLALPEPTYHE